MPLLNTYADLKKLAISAAGFLNKKPTSLTVAFILMLAKEHDQKADIDTINADILETVQFIILADKNLLSTSFQTHPAKDYITSLQTPLTISGDFAQVMDKLVQIAVQVLSVMQIVPDQFNLEKIISVIYNQTTVAESPEFPGCKEINSNTVKTFLHTRNIYPLSVKVNLQEYQSIKKIVSASEGYYIQSARLALASSSQYAEIKDEKTQYATLVKLAAGKINIEHAYAYIRQRPELLFCELKDKQNFLHIVAAQNRVDILQELNVLATAAIITASKVEDANKKTAIQIAAEAQFWELVKAFPSGNNAEARYGSALLTAASYGRNDVILDMLEKQASVMWRFVNTGLLAIHHCLQNSNGQEVLDKLVQVDRSIVNAQQATNLPTPLTLAITNEKVPLENLQWLLSQENLDINLLQANKSPIKLAIEKNAHEKLKLILTSSHYNKINFSESERQACLGEKLSSEMKSILTEDAHLLEIVVAAEVNVNIVSAVKLLENICQEKEAAFFQPIIESILVRFPEKKEELIEKLLPSIFEKMIKFKNEEFIGRLFSLIKDKAAILKQQYENKKTAMHLACEFNLAKTVELFMPHADLTLLDLNSRTPIEIVSANLLWGLIKLFKKQSDMSERYGSALIVAARENETKAVLLLLDLNAALNFMFNDSGLSAIHFYLERNNHEVLEKLCTKNSTIVNLQWNETKPTPLSHVLNKAEANVETLQWLLQQPGIDVYKKTKNKTPFVEAAEVGNIAKLNVLLNYSGLLVSVDEYKQAMRTSSKSFLLQVESSLILLRNQIKKNNIDAAVEILQVYYENNSSSILEVLDKLDLQSNKILTERFLKLILSFALKKQDVKLIEYLYNFIEDKNSFLKSRGDNNNTPLHFACLYANESCMSLFLNDAINEVNNDSHYPVHCLVLGNNLNLLAILAQLEDRNAILNKQLSDQTSTPLITALTSDAVKIQTLISLLDDPLVDVNKRQAGSSPFYYAVKAGQEDKVLVLLAHPKIKISLDELKKAKGYAQASLLALLNSQKVTKQVIVYELTAGNVAAAVDLLIAEYKRTGSFTSVLAFISEIKRDCQLLVKPELFNDVILLFLKNQFQKLIDSGQENIFEQLFNSLDGKNKATFIRDNNQALNLACKFGRENTVKLLIDAGADVTVVHEEKTAIQMVADNNHWPLIKHFPCLDATRAGQARYGYALLLAIHNNISDVVTIADDLLQKGSLQDFRYLETGVFPLHAALLHNQTVLIDILIKNKKDIANDQHNDVQAATVNKFPTPIFYALKKMEVTVGTLKCFLILANASLKLDIQCAGKTAIELNKQLVGWSPAKNRIFKCFARLMALLKNIEVSNLQDLDVLNNKKFIDDVLAQAKKDGVTGANQVQAFIDVYEHELCTGAQKEVPLAQLKSPLTLDEFYKTFDPFFADMPKSEQILKDDFRANLLLKIRQMALAYFSNYLSTLQFNYEKKSACLAAKEHAVFFKHRSRGIGRTDAVIFLDKLISQFSAPDMST